MRRGGRRPPAPYPTLGEAPVVPEETLNNTPAGVFSLGIATVLYRQSLEEKGRSSIIRLES